jgi:hypothetical protein
MALIKCYECEKETSDQAPACPPTAQDQFEDLRELRQRLANADNVPPFMVCPNKTLRDMLLKRPTTKEELLGVDGVGPIRLEKYGDEFLAVLQRFGPPDGGHPHEPEDKLVQMLSEKEFTEHLEALATGHDPRTGAELSKESVFLNVDVVRGLFSLLRLIDVQQPSPTEPPRLKSPATIYLTAMDAARAVCGVECEGTEKRFSRPSSLSGWFSVDSPPVRCPGCEGAFSAFRSLYFTRGLGPTPQPNFYWALVCCGCARVFQPSELSPKNQKEVYRAHRPPDPNYGLPLRRHAWLLPSEEQRADNLRGGRPYRHWANWSPEECEDLCDMFKDGATVPEIAELFQRTNNAIRRKLQGLELLD